ncbi:MAG: DUF417 family protein [Pyrinomonadaceae bacterium]
MVLILLMIGTFKFTAVEAKGIQPLVANSPLMSWLYSVLSLQGVSNLIGGAEIVIAILILTRRFAPKLSAVGSIGAILMFLTTLTFLITTPGMWTHVAGYPLPVPADGGFVLKDIFLLGAAVWTAGEALRGVKGVQNFSQET